MPLEPRFLSRSGRVWINPHDHHRIARVAEAERRIAPADIVRGAVDDLEPALGRGVGQCFGRGSHVGALVLAKREV